MGKRNERKLTIVCPSRDRAKKVITKKLIPSLKLIVSETEKKEYEKHNPDVEVIATPKHIKGITPTRQWILENFEDVFMIDDDVSAIRRNYHHQNNEPYLTDPEKILDIINNLFSIAIQTKSKAFAFSKIRNPLLYNSFKPIKMTGYLNASFCGFVKDHNLEYDLSMTEGEDHYMSCLCIYKHRYCLIDDRYSFLTDGNFKSSGGCNSYRTKQSMLKNTIYLRKLFGEVIYYKEPVGIKKNVNMGERSLKFPY